MNYWPRWECLSDVGITTFEYLFIQKLFLLKWMITRIWYVLVKDKRESLNKFPDFFRMATFIDSTRMKLYSPSK